MNGTTRKFMRATSLGLYSTFLILASMASGQERAPAGYTQQRATAEIRPFKVHIPDRTLIDLNRRLATAKWPDQLPGTTWEYGADIEKVRALTDYWQTQYNWRAQEARINRFHQYTTMIDGQQIHFIHERSPRPDAIPCY